MSVRCLALAALLALLAVGAHSQSSGDMYIVTEFRSDITGCSKDAEIASLDIVVEGGCVRSHAVGSNVQVINKYVCQGGVPMKATCQDPVCTQCDPPVAIPTCNDGSTRGNATCRSMPTAEEIGNTTYTITWGAYNQSLATQRCQSPWVEKMIRSAVGGCQVAGTTRAAAASRQIQCIGNSARWISFSDTACTQQSSVQVFDPFCRAEDSSFNWCGNWQVDAAGIVVPLMALLLTASSVTLCLF